VRPTWKRLPPQRFRKHSFIIYAGPRDLALSLSLSLSRSVPARDHSRLPIRTAARAPPFSLDKTNTASTSFEPPAFDTFSLFSLYSLRPPRRQTRGLSVPLVSPPLWPPHSQDPLRSTCHLFSLSPAPTTARTRHKF
jgi:hypothetical protein